MSAKIKSIGKATVHDEDKSSLLEALAAVTALAEKGEIAGMVLVGVRADRSFAVWQTGDLKRIETVGLLAQAQHDLLAGEEPA